MNIAQITDKQAFLMWALDRFTELLKEGDEKKLNRFVESYDREISLCPYCLAPTEERSAGDEGWTFCSDDCGCLEGTSVIHSTELALEYHERTGHALPEEE